MKKYSIWSGWLTLICIVLFSCVEDKGDYIYHELNDLTIEELEAEYTVEQFTRLKIEPKITVKEGTFNPDNYEYLWYFYKLSGAPFFVDTLSAEKDLDVEIGNTLGSYDLYFRVTDKETGVLYTLKRYPKVQVVNTYSVGLMILSNVEGNADVTFINSLDAVNRHVYQKVNSAVAGKNPTGICNVYRAMIGTCEEMIVIMTDDERGGTVVDPLDWTYIKDFREMFYLPPKVIKPRVFGQCDYQRYEYVINDGGIYTRTNYEAGFPKYWNRIDGDYEAAPFAFFSMGATAVFIYDQKNKRFVKMDTPLNDKDAVVALDPITDAAFNPAAVGMKMLWGGAFGPVFTRTYGRAVMEDQTGIKYAVSFDMAKGKIAPRKVWPLVEGAGRAVSYTTSARAKFLYYAYDNKVVCMSFDTGNQLNVYEFPENVDYIECDQVKNTDQMWVAVSDGSGKEDSGSVYIMEMSTDGSLRQAHEPYRNVCGKVVDFDYRK